MNAASRQNAMIDNENVDAVYTRMAPLYDFAFAEVAKPGRRASAAVASQAEGPILDVGVGTGLELPMFEADTQVFGVDLSEAMLRRAARRVERDNLGHVVGLAKMDGTRLAFADASFACVVSPYVLTTVPDPVAILDEMARVLRPGGEIVLVNHVIGPDDPLKILEKFLERHVAPRIGWRPSFPWAIIGDWIDGRKDMELVERRLLPPFGVFTLIRIRREVVGSGAAAPKQLEMA